MPPFVPRKRSRSPDEREASPPPKKRTTKAPKSSSHAKPSLFDAVDSPHTKSISLKESHRILDSLGGDDDEDDSSSEADSDDFEDVPPKRKKVEHEDDDDVDWEDAIHEDPAPVTEEPSVEFGDVTISVREDGSYVEPLVSAATGKKGPSKRERHIRVLTHTLHVQSLMWHNTVRNSWLNDSEVQKTLLDALPASMHGEVSRWKRSMGLLSKQELEKEKAAAVAKRSKAGKKARPKKELKGRDWSYSAEHTEVGNIDLSQGDPIFRLLKMLAAYWRKRFTITAPGLRKIGYMPLRRLRDELKGWEKDQHAEQYGERIAGLTGFRHLARLCEGSRDVGNQLFIALLRGIGLDVRMVTNLQPAGFGWSKNEDAHAKSTKSTADTAKERPGAASAKPTKPLPPPKLREALTPKQMKKLPKEQPTRASTRGNKEQPINLDDSDSSLSSPPSDIEDHGANIDEELAIIDVMPISKKRPTKKYDRDLPHPVYWAEVLSPATMKYIPVDPVVLSTVASNDELLATFEPRGSKADKGKQVICYTIAFSADGTAKDVTIRYLKRHQLPGKTKGMRMPIEKVPIHNRKGKIKRYEESDWFGELMLRFRKLDSKRDQADQLEEDTDLKPYKASKEEKPVDKESLAYYKNCADFVLEEHLRREEALLPGSKPVKSFTAGKGDKEKEYKVFKRDDIVHCKTVESWHKEGRELKPGEQPMKYVPIRAVTLQRKREIEDAQRETGEKPQQGLYSEAQTDWIVPPPIVDGVIPRNAFGNMDVYVPTMVPRGAIHLPMKGTAKICKRLEIDYAEACTGFEFGKQRAVPVITGVVIAKENAGLVRNAWKIEQAEQKRKEDVKRTAAALHWWRKMLMGMRIIDRMRAEYTNTSTTEDEVNPFVRKAVKTSITRNESAVENHDTAGGFLVDDEEHDEHSHDAAGGFLIKDDDQEDDHLNAKLGVTDDNKYVPNTPISLQSMHEPEPQAQHRTVRRKKANTTIDVQGEEEMPQQQRRSKNNRIRADHAQKLKSTKHSATRSPYFSSQEMIDNEADDVEDEASDHEVITVRKTTARTRRT